MFLVGPRLYSRHVPPGTRLLTAAGQHRAETKTRGKYSHYLDGLTGRTGSNYLQCKADELEQAWRNGQISYQDACDELEELDGEP